MRVGVPRAVLLLGISGEAGLRSPLLRGVAPQGAGWLQEGLQAGLPIAARVPGLPRVAF
jgi:hypothetical protein